MLPRAVWIALLAVLVWFALHVSLWAQGLLFALIVIPLPSLVRAGYERLRYGPRQEISE